MDCHCPICGCKVKVRGFCNHCQTYYCHWIYRVKKEEKLEVKNEK